MHMKSNNLSSQTQVQAFAGSKGKVPSVGIQKWGNDLVFQPNPKLNMKIFDLQEKSSDDAEQKQKKISEFLANPGNKKEPEPTSVESQAMAEQRRKTYIQMISKQKGFLFAIFVSSILLSALFIFSFVAFVFKLGFSKPDPLQGNQNYSVFGNSTSPGWTGYLNSSMIHQLLGDEQKYFRSFPELISDYQTSMESYFGVSSHRNIGLKKYSDSYNRNFAFTTDTPTSDQKM